MTAHTKRVITTFVGIPFLFAVIHFVPPWGFTLVTFFVALVSLNEFYAMMRSEASKKVMCINYALTAILFCALLGRGVFFAPLVPFFVIVPLALRYKASLIALTLDKKGVPQDKNRRLELAAVIVADCQEKGFPLEELYIDPVVLPVNVAQTQLEDTLESIEEFKIISQPAPKTVVGLSNVSQGIQDRSLVNRTFLIMAIASGLDAAILDPLDKQLMDSLITAELIQNKQIYCDSFLQAYKKR